jgi:hypothetical protein
LLAVLERELELSGGQADLPVPHASRHSLYLNPARCLAARIAFEQVEPRVTGGHGLKLRLTMAYDIDRKRLETEPLAGLKPVGITGAAILGVDGDVRDELALLTRRPRPRLMIFAGA